MYNTLTIRVSDIKTKGILKNLADLKLIEIIGEVNTNWNPTKINQAKKLLSSYNDAKLHQAGKKKLQTAQSLINEL